MPTDPLRTYIEPAQHRGWEAVAEEPVETSKWYLPPIHRVGRPTKDMARRAIPKAVQRLERDVRRRERGVASSRERERLREDV